MVRQRARRAGRFLPGVEALEDRCVPACNFLVRGSTLLIQAPTTPAPTNDRILIFDNGSSGPNNVVAFCKAAFFPNVPITRIRVTTGAGNDRVTYDQTANLAGAREVDVNFGAGNDVFAANLRWNLLAGANLTLNVNGGPGNDRLDATMIGSLAANANLQINFDGGGGNNVLNVFSASFVNVAAGANLGVRLNGNGFSDHLFSDYQGVMDGTYSVNATGGRGPNRIDAEVDLAPGSTGTVAPSSVLGGHAHDDLTFVVHNPGTASSNDQLLDGMGGFDNATRTTNVVVFNVGTDTVVP